MLRNAARRWWSWKVMKRDLVVASTQHHHAHWLKYYPRPPWVPSFVKSRMLRPLQTDFLLFQQIFFILVCIHAGNSRVPPRDLTSRPKPCRGNKRFLQCNFSFLNNIEGKITECWLVNEEGIFFLICFVKRAKLLAHDWSSDYLATAYSIEKFFFCNNGISFQDSWRGLYRIIKW